MAKRYGRRRSDGIYEYGDSLEALEISAAREDEEFLKETLAIVGFLLGAVVTYGLVGSFAPESPKVLWFSSILGGGCLNAVICATLAPLLRSIFVGAFTVGVIGAMGYLLWRLL